MANLKYDKEITALLLIDPYNDFISDGGKVEDETWKYIAPVQKAAWLHKGFENGT
jgi:ureidoacrylate peracid hydrolase